MFTGRLGDAAILDTRRASTLTGTAQKTEIEMLRKAFIELDTSFGSGFDEMNPAARRLRLQLQGSIGRALVQTEAAMNALIEFREVQRWDFFPVATRLPMNGMFQI